MDPTQYPALPIYAIFASGLCLFVMGLDGISASMRGKSKTTPNEEDAAAGRGLTLVHEDPEAVARVVRVWRNAFANIVPFLIVAYLFVLTKASARSALIYFGVFAGARLLHAIVYLAGKQPWRTLFFTVGQLATLGLAVQVIRYFI